MAKLVDATDLIGLSLGMETYQVITFKFRETLELIMGNPEPNPVFLKEKDKLRVRQEKKDRCRDSMEAVLTNGVNGIALVKVRSKLLKRSSMNVYTYVFVLKYYLK